MGGEVKCGLHIVRLTGIEPVTYRLEGGSSSSELQAVSPGNLLTTPANDHVGQNHVSCVSVILLAQFAHQPVNTTVTSSHVATVGFEPTYSSL